MKKFEFLEHTAEMKFRAYGRTLEEVFENSVLAISNLILRGKKIEGKKRRRARIEGKDNEQKLHNLIDEIIYLLDAKNFLVSKVKIKSVKDSGLIVEFYGDDSEKYSGLDHVKAATYSEIYVKPVKTQGEKSWEAQAVVDV